MRKRSTIARLIALLMTLTLVAAACGGDDDDGGGDTAGQEGEDGGGQEGGELIELGSFATGVPEHIDPALNVTIDAYQVINALYDGLTEFDFSDPENPELKPLVAESYESNEDATEWTFQIREGLTFSNGEEVLPSSFQRAWERATDADFAGDYSYLFNFIEGGAEKLCYQSDAESCQGVQGAETLAGVQADDENMTLTVQMDAPYANFPAVAGFQTFFPMPAAVEELADQSEWENGLMIGNGPYKMAEPRTDQVIVLERNDEWSGDIFGNERATLDRIEFRISQDEESAYNSFEAGEGGVTIIPAGRYQEADDNYETTLDVPTLGTVYFEMNWEDPVIGGPDNALLRKAIQLAIDREEISEVGYDGFRPPAAGVTPPGIPGYEEGLCENCRYDQEAAQEAFDDWRAEGNELTEPLRIQLNPGAGWEDPVQIIIDNLSQIGIEATAEPLDAETYFSQLSDGACQICRSGWYADYPTYDNFTYDLFHTDAIGGNNHGLYSNPEFDRLVDEAKANPDEEAAAEQYREAEQLLLNEDFGVLPVLEYRGDYVYNPDIVTNFEQTPLGIVLYEQVTVSG